ncbi:MAG: translation initiation factor IF-2 subunit gamma [Nanoarchaeota archaeon]|nr:translation initiation factor IF-2 subunit gamma [Nanoarchaeota archaeon]
MPAKKASQSTAKKAAKKTTTKKAASSSSKKETIQPEINIGLVGHVDHGKTTLTEQLSGKWTDTHSEELKRGITIRLGYADTTIRKDPKLPEPDCYTTKETHPVTGTKTEPVRKISFVDAPGHESLMATMLSGATIMDGALLLVAANENCPQAQTQEHLMALELSGIKNIIVVQNKIDLVDEERALRNYKEIRKFLKGSSFEDAPIVPISAQHGVNIDVLLATIQQVMPTPERDEHADSLMYVARSFDVNKPGNNVFNLVGGILGGSVVSGQLKVGDEIELRPGRLVEEQNKLVAKPLITTITGMMTGGKSVDTLHPGGSVSVLTRLDPSIVKGDKLTGNLVGKPGTLPPVWSDIKLKTHILERVVNVGEDFKIDPLRKGEMLLLNVNSAKTVGLVEHLGKGIAQCKLRLPICAAIGDNVTISRRLGNRFRLIGYGTLVE